MISVYGGTGFVGSEFCKQNKNSIVIDRNQSKPESEKVLYFISTVDNYNVYKDPYLDVNTNLVKLIDVLESCRENKIEEFNFISSWFVYGMNNKLPVKESDHCDPMGFYSITKYAAEKLIQSYCKTFNMNYRIMRLGNVIGENDTGISLQKNALQQIIKDLINDYPVRLYNNGSDIRDFIHVSDCAKAIRLCMEKGSLNEIYNISNGEGNTIGELLDHSLKFFESKSEITYIESPHFHKSVQAKDMILDNSKLKSFDYSPDISIHTAIELITKKYLSEKE
jgi:nucleoside-diphosphate-sugar epimerase